MNGCHATVSKLRKSACDRSKSKKWNKYKIQLALQRERYLKCHNTFASKGCYFLKCLWHVCFLGLRFRGLRFRGLRSREPRKRRPWKRRPWPKKHRRGTNTKTAFAREREEFKSPSSSFLFLFEVCVSRQPTSETWNVQRNRHINSGEITEWVGNLNGKIIW